MQRTLFHKNAYNTTEPVKSFWESSVNYSKDDFKEIENNENCDVAIIGAGFTGLSAALHLSKDYNIDVKVLEAGHIGWGASGRNGGFCCISPTALTDEQLIKKFGINETKIFYESQIEAVQLVNQICKEYNIDCDITGNGFFEIAHKSSEMKEFSEWGSQLSKLFGIKTKLLSKEEFSKIGYESNNQFGALHLDLGFGLNPLKFLLGLAKSAKLSGAKIYQKSRVTRWEKANGKNILHTKSATIKADKVIIATNGYTLDDLHPSLSGRFLPAISNIVVTRPMSDTELALHQMKTTTPMSTSHHLFYYYRKLPDNRMLFGARGGMTGSPKEEEKMRAWLSGKFKEMFPLWNNIDITHFWSGFVCLTTSLTPAIGSLNEDKSVFFSFGYHGNGVNTGPWAGKKLADLIGASNSKNLVISKVMSGLPKELPFPFPLLRYSPRGRRLLRQIILRSAYAYYRFRDLF